jgi:hypothetical protein
MGAAKGIEFMSTFSALFVGNYTNGSDDHCKFKAFPMAARLLHGMHGSSNL